MLRLSPNASSTSIVTSNDSGRVIREMTVVRKLARKEHDDHEDGTLVEGPLDVVDGVLDKCALAEYVGGHMHVGRQVLLQVGDGGVQSFGQLDGAGVGLFGDGQQYGGLATFGSQTELGLLGTDAHVGHVLQGHGHSALSGLDDRCGHLLHVLGGDHSSHYVFVAVFVDDTSVGVLVHASGYGHHLAECHAVMLHLLRVNQDLILLDVTSEHCHLGHASGGQQSGTECPVGQRPQVQHRGAVGCQAYDHQLSEDG